ncbi:hypothetical protein AB3Y40_11475 [Yoonia sp. R2331]|uniref:hypothetical protein n=1 Tax=Yoonia sp. R2331 TaxID=3237238 RepID=UPI0034E5E26E
MFNLKFIIAAAAALTLSACAGINTDGERAVVGAGVGCLAGEAINGDCTTGALVGAVGGALANDL